MKRWQFVLAVVSTCSLFACFDDSMHTLSGKALEGQVVEEGTGKPIGGALVVVMWSGDEVPTGFTGHNSPTLCYHAATATSDEAGHYYIAGWKSRRPFRIKSGDSSSMAYKSGYLWRPRAGTTITLAPVGDNHQFESRTPDCFMGGESRRNLFPILKAMYEDLKPMAQSEDEKQRMRNLRWMAAHDAIATDEIEDSTVSERKVQEFLKGNLL